MRRAHIELLGELSIRRDGRQIRRKCLIQLIVDIIVHVTPDRRDPCNDVDGQNSFVMLLYKIRKFFEFRQQRPMPCLFNQLLGGQDHGREDRYTADHAEQNTLRHDGTDIESQRKAHEAEGNKAGDRRDGRSDDGLQRLIDCLSHRRFVVIRIALYIFLETVPQKDRVIHRHAELQDRCQRLRDIRDLPEKHIRSEIVDDAHSDRQKKEERCKECVHRKTEDNDSQKNCQKNVNRFLCVGQIPGIRDNAGDAGEETILPRDLPDRRDRFHRLIRRCPGVIRDRHERRVSADERIPHILREHLDRHIERCEAVIPDHVMHMGDFPDLCFQL